MIATMQHALDYLDQRPQRVAELCQELVRFDTAFMGPGTPARQEQGCQEWIAKFLSELGCEIDQWEPDPATLSDHPMYQPGLAWTGRPITVGILRGSGEGRSLILNGHIDTVSAEPIERWTHDPWSGDIEGDRLFGRGSCDMKGGIAAFLAVVEAAVRTGTRLSGDLILQFVTDEETTGMGTIAVIERGYRADACIVPEPSSFETWIAYRGILYGSIHVEGRPAHGEIPQPHWRAGGGVSAIDEMRHVMNGIDALNFEWRGRPDQVHPLLSTPSIVTTRISGGEFIASVPASCDVDLDVTYLPTNVDSQGYGSEVRREIETHVAAWVTGDPWLREHPPQVSWFQEYPAAEMNPADSFVQTVLRSAREEGVESRVGGFDSWADAASYSKIGVPAACLGPGNAFRAHSIDEWVSIDELRRCSRILARLIANWCEPA